MAADSGIPSVACVIMKRMSVLRRAFWILAALLLAPAPSRASQVLPVNLEERVRHAGHVVSGRVTEVQVVQDERVHGQVTLVTLEVSRAAKGQAGRTLTFRMFGGLGANGQPVVAGLPRFDPGEEVILFLHPEGRLGLTSPVGFGQGKFVVSRDRQGQRVVQNQFGNRMLFRGLSTDGSRRLGQAGERWKDGGAMPPDALLNMIDALAAAGRAGVPR
jgi:hypothetical protein